MEDLIQMLKRRRELRIPPKSRMGGDKVYFRYGATEDDFFDLSDEDDKWELLDSTLIIHSPASKRHVEVTQFIFRLLSDYVERKGLGGVFYTPAVIRLSEGKNLEPDIFFLKKGALKRYKEMYVEGPPDFVIEVSSRWRRGYDFGDKLKAYKESWTSEIWIVDMHKKALHRYLKRNGYNEKIKFEGQVKSVAVKGFWIEVEWLFQTPLPSKWETLDKILQGAIS